MQLKYRRGVYTAKAPTTAYPFAASPLSMQLLSTDSEATCFLVGCSPYAVASIFSRCGNRH